MKAGDIYIETHIDNTEFEKDAKKLKNKMDDIADDTGKSAGKKILDGITGGLGKIGSVGKGLITGIGKIATGILTTVGTVVKGIMVAGIKIGAILIGALGGVGVFAGLIAGAFKRIGEENQELLANIKYIVFVISNAFYNAAAGLANMIANAISKIINLLAKVIVYTAYIVKAWFGIDILANSTAADFQKSQEATKGTAGNLGKAAKNAKDLKKQLAGFDEMNVLQDNDTGAGGGAGGAGGGFVAPTIDLEGLQADIPEWIKWIADNKDLMIAALLGIAGAIAAIYLGAGLLMSLGIGIIIAGIVLLVQDILKFLKSPTWENFVNILRDIAIVLAGVALVLVIIGAATAALVVAIIAAVVAIVALIIKYWDEIKAVLGAVGNWIKTHIIDPVVEFFKGLWDKIVAIFSPVYTVLKGYYTFIFEMLKLVFETVTSILGTIWSNIKIVIDNIKQIVSFLWNTLMTILKPIFEWIYSNIIQPVWNTINDIINKIKNAFSTLVGIIKTIFSPVVDFFRGIIDKIWGFVRTIATTVGNVIGGAFKGAVNGVLNAVQTILNVPIVAINKLIDTINKVPGLHLTRLNTFNLPRLAMGGIINQPGRGVMVGSAIAGERGAEGVIPLTDSQQMALLGEAIGKYITVNANITNTMNGRVISRELKIIQNEDDFAYNR